MKNDVIVQTMIPTSFKHGILTSKNFIENILNLSKNTLSIYPNKVMKINEIKNNDSYIVQTWYFDFKKIYKEHFKPK